MFYVNEVRFLGRAVKAAELKNLGESRVASFRLVSNRRIKKQSGEYEEKATYIDVECWNQRADYASSYIKRGTPVLVRGQLETDEWEKDGQKRSKLKIYASEVQAEKPRDDNSSDSPDEAPANEAVASTASNLPF